uniref:Solute carrier family 40 protein n=1 Tax=Coccolithus braarudii TaxID=221442 RepID=A0A7S0PZN8_9EUKA|mmetsp:Transcript_20701/g.44448  ORF Transcript_20701/g.44448 Transcript_20701/m.44448 type:complete len:559 (+) Transcript_20701:73-1749(+)
MWPGNMSLLLIVCALSALVSFKPSEPFLVAFLHCVKELSTSTVYHSIFPLWTYAYLALLPSLSAAAELIGCRTVVFIGMAGRVATLLIMLLGGNELWLLQLSQATVAAGFASHPALSAILYQRMPAEAYARAVGFVGFAGVVADVLSSLLGQVLLDVGSSLTQLFVISAVATFAATALVLALPSSPPNGLPRLVDRTITPSCFSAADSLAESMCTSTLGTSTLGENPEHSERVKRRDSIAANGDDVVCCCARAELQTEPPPKQARMSTTMLLWSDVMRGIWRSGALRYYAWLAVGVAVHHLVYTYWQGLPASGLGPQPAPSPSSPPPPRGILGAPPAFPPPPPPPCVSSSSQNGWVQASASLLGGCAALIPYAAERRLQPDLCAKLRAGLVVLAPLVLALLLSVMALTEQVGMYNASFVGFHVLFELMRVVCTTEGARCVARAKYRGLPRFALVGGLSTTATLVLQTIAQLGVSVYKLPIRSLFELLAVLLLGLFAACVVIGIAERCIAATAATTPLPPERGHASDDCAEDARPYQQYVRPPNGTHQSPPPSVGVPWT